MRLNSSDEECSDWTKVLARQGLRFIPEGAAVLRENGGDGVADCLCSQPLPMEAAGLGPISCGKSIPSG
jgi:hypothetical protein